MFNSSGNLIIKEKEYGNSYIEVDQDIVRYYRKQIPFKTQPQKYPPHITVIREEIYDNKLINEYFAYETKTLINFKYSHYIYWNNIYVWLAVECSEAEILREYVKLSAVSNLTKSPDGQHRFHITIGNMKFKY